MLLAVLEKRCGFKLGSKDVFLNITGGLKLTDPAMDLAVVSAILSSSEALAIEKNTCFAAEIGLSGEVRPVSRVQQRVVEASRLGFKRILVSARHDDTIVPAGIGVIKIAKLQELPKVLFT